LQLLRRVRAGSVLHLKLKPAGAADAANRRRRKYQRQTILHLAELPEELPRDRLRCQLRFAFSLVERKQRQEDRPAARNLRRSGQRSRPIPIV